MVYLIRKNTANGRRYNKEQIGEFLYQNCLIKTNIVAKDERDKGVRQLLNFGHTCEHALEARLNYEYRHG